MAFLNSTILILILSGTITLLLIAMVYLNLQFYKEKKAFKIRIEALQFVISEISKEQSGQLNQLSLSEDMERKLKSAKAILSNDIFRLNYELFEILSKNNLLKK